MRLFSFLLFYGFIANILERRLRKDFLVHACQLCHKDKIILPSFMVTAPREGIVKCFPLYINFIIRKSV